MFIKDTFNKHLLSIYIRCMDMVNVNLGVPFEAIVQRAIHAGYAGSQVEVLRQALLQYEKDLDEREELMLVHKAVQKEMEEIKSGKAKTYTLAEVKKELGWK